MRLEFNHGNKNGEWKVLHPWNDRPAPSISGIGGRCAVSRFCSQLQTVLTVDLDVDTIGFP
jgi:hypothetical protein